MAAYDPSEWSDLFVATAGAGAALAGLIFVGVSINVERILKSEGLPERGFATVLLLLSVVLVSVMGLIPGQSRMALGAELLGESLVLGAAIAMLAGRGLRGGPVSRLTRAVRLLFFVAGTVPLVIGGASLMAEAGGGLYWTVAGILCALAAGMTNGWVLMVEILR